MRPSGQTPQILNDGEVFGALLDGALVSWTLRNSDGRYPGPVAERDGYRCAVPGCTSRDNHHDHQRCLHAGLMRISGQAADGLLFELGLRSTGSPLATYRSGDILESPAYERSSAALERAA